MRKTVTGGILLAGLLAATLGTSPAAQAETLRIKVTNLTAGQIFSPPIVIAHPRNVSPFKLAEAASDGLAALAEGGDSSGLATEMAALGADTATTGAFIQPGDTGIINIETTGPNRRISVLGMLVTTNDAFFAINGEKAVGRFSRFTATAYDAGSEANNEMCDYIPGPPCAGGTLRDTAEAEGFVHVHSGIHGVGELVPADSDWANPVAIIQVIRRDSVQ